MPWVTPPAGGGEGHMEAGWGPGVGKEDVSILVPSYHIHARHPLASWAPPPWVPSPGSSLSPLPALCLLPVQLPKQVSGHDVFIAILTGSLTYLSLTRLSLYT